MLRLLLMLGVAVLARGSSVTFHDCGSAYDLEAVEIAGCGATLPCYLTLGEDIPVSLHFFADFASSSLDQKVIITVNNINLNTEVTPEPCEMAVCPVPTDCVSSITSVMSVPRNMALNSRGYLRWRVYNERRVQVVCYSVLVQTQSPLQKILRAAAANYTARPPHTPRGKNALEGKSKNAMMPVATAPPPHTVKKALEEKSKNGIAPVGRRCRVNPTVKATVEKL
ncbi:hypothetical protein JYU34_018686 [Plutella xylostella]|uniref:MD-2-related lipid-recognition domain-containing protein n=1 Tax=Plutella xylostella TaxID=51655 RepID=A0ABQ7PYG8_PLUXY|nr:hypothetical protein JYU34_018686 [Plutella xylostella]